MPSGQTFLQAFNDIFQNYSMSKPIHAIELTNGLQSEQHFCAKFVSANACVYTSLDSEKRSSFLIITMHLFKSKPSRVVGLPRMNTMFPF